MKPNINTVDYWDKKHSLESMKPEIYAEGVHKKLFLGIVDKIKKIGARRILDVACGNGHLYYHLKKQNIPIDYHGVDFSRIAIENVRATWPELKKLCAEDCTTLSYFKYEYYDAVILSEVMEHLEASSLFSTMSACWRIIKTGGSLIITVPEGAANHKEHLRSYSNISLAGLYNGILPLTQVNIEKIDRWLIATGVK